MDETELQNRLQRIERDINELKDSIKILSPLSSIALEHYIEKILKELDDIKEAINGKDKIPIIPYIPVIPIPVYPNMPNPIYIGDTWTTLTTDATNNTINIRV